ncbi:MAG: TolC family protein [Tannerella sp.]|jgi:outer membrane protein TolC|nr:TolC family protein [Tannerella sp.]
MKRSFIIIFACIACCIASHAQEIYTLEKCIGIGLERNYSIRIIQNEEQISSNNATPGNAGYLPIVDLSGGFNGTVYNYDYDYTDGTSESVKNVNSETANAGINLNWTVFDGFGIQADYSKLKELQQMGTLNTRIAIEDLVANIAAEYYNLVRQRIRLRNLRSAVRLSKERLRIVEERYTIGSMSRLDLQQAKVDFNADSSRLLTQYETVNASQIKLNELMGLDSVNRHLSVRDTVPIQSSLLEEKDLWQKTLTNNASLLASHKNKTLSELDYKKIRSRNYPYLRLNAGYGYTDNRYGTGSTELQKRLGLNYGVTVGITLFDGMNRRREQQNARLRIKNTELRTQELELGLKADLSNLWMAYRNNLDLWELEKENLVTAQENYEIAIERYKLGDLSGIELREAQNNLLEAEERRSIAEYNTKLCEISLLQLSGQILTYLGSPEKAEG